MLWILLLVVPTFAIICVMTDVSLTLYPIEENNNVTVTWDTQTHIDLSLTHLTCYFDTTPLKVFYKVIKGDEDSNAQHQQFSGRVQLDKDALRDGRIRLHVSTVTAEDSGTYRCYVAANYDQKKQKWQLLYSETFALNVSQLRDGNSSHLSLNTTSGPTSAEGSGYEQRNSDGGFIIGILVLAVLVAALVYSTLRKKHHGPVIPCVSTGLMNHYHRTVIR